MAAELTLTDHDVAFLFTLLRSTPQPLTTAQLVEALRSQAVPA